MNPFRLSAADTVKIAGTTFHFGEVCHDGYVLRRAPDNAVEFHSNTDLLDMWVAGLVEPCFANSNPYLRGRTPGAWGTVK